MHRAMQISLLVCWLCFACTCKLVSSAECYKNFDKNEFANCKLMSPTFAMHWKADSSNVTFGIDADEVSDGYVSLGVSEAGGMKAADIWVVTKRPSGTWTVWDMHSVAYTTPIMDTKQDVTLVGMPKVTSNSIAAVITRKLRGCDVSDMDILPNISTPFIWAHGPTWKYHGNENRGGTQLLLDGGAVTPAVLDGAKTLEFLMPNVEIPTNRTTYMCTNFEMPNDRKYHAVTAKFKADSPMVHHMIVYACTDIPPIPIGTLYPCSNMPTECTTPTFLWAPGTADWTPPEDAAVPIGKGYTQYAALQLHYTNPGSVTGQMDSSGVTISYTPTLRQYDIGLLILGQSNLTIPGGESNHTVGIGLCPAECTSKFSKPLNVLGVGFHQHEIGLTIKTQRFRNGAELPLMGVRNRWDFNFQNMNAPKPNADVILPGDTLVTTCSYNSTTRTNVTTFGEETIDEMCFSFIQYYPRQEQMVCMSRVDRGFSTCASIQALSELAQKFTKVDNTTAEPASNTTIKPAANTNPPAKSGLSATVSRGANRDANASQIDYQAYLAEAFAQGYFVMFDPDAYNLSKFTPYVPEDNCPAFLSAQDYGPIPADKPKNAASLRAVGGLNVVMVVVVAAVAWWL